MNKRLEKYDLLDLKLMLKYWKEYCDYCEKLYQEDNNCKKLKLLK